MLLVRYIDLLDIALWPVDVTSAFKSRAYGDYNMNTTDSNIP